jgi:integrase
VILRTILRTAYEHELVPTDPLAGVTGIKYTAEHRADFTPEQTEAFFQRDNFRSDASYALFRTAYLTGMRRAEVCSMDRLQDRGDVLQVDRAFKDDAFTVVGLPKWGKTREIVITAPLRAHLDWWYSRSPFVHDGPVFPMATPNFWRLEFRHALKSAGIKGVVPHSLRHTLASDLDEQGVSASVIRETLGHGTEEMRARYTHVRRATATSEMEVAMVKIAGGVQ